MKKYFVLCFVIIFGITACATDAIIFQDQLEIHDIQSCSHTSPYVGQTVKGIVGVVTHKVSNGFTMQTVTPDDQICSSEAIFVFTKEYPLVMVADLVQVMGLVDEFSNGTAEEHNLSKTEIEDSEYKILQSDYELPDPIVIDDLLGVIPTLLIENDEMIHFTPIEDGLDFYESIESMLVQVVNGQIVAPRNAYDEIVVLADSFVDLNLVSNQGALLNTVEDANPEKIMIKLPTNFDEDVNVGDWLENPIIGMMDYSYGNYKLVAFSPIEITRRQQIVEPFMPIFDGLTIATYNVENLSPMNENSKYLEIAKQIVKTLLSPDVLVLNEIMDNSGSVDDGFVTADNTINRLISAIRDSGGPDYSFSDTAPYNNQDGGLQGGNIRTVLLFRQDKGITLDKNFSQEKWVTVKNGNLMFKENPLVVGNGYSAFSETRKPRVWLLSQKNKQFIVVGVHLTSQGANSPDWGNLQPPQKPEESKRVEQAEIIYEKLREIYMFNLDIPIFIAGDINDLPWSNTVSTIKQELFINAAEMEVPEERYSYIFEGNAQELDYIFVNQNLASDVLQARFIHVNSFQDYSRSISDHDPMIIEFRFDQ